MSYDDPCKLRQRTNFGNHWKIDHKFEDILAFEHSKMAFFPLPWLVFSYIFGTRYHGIILVGTPSCPPSGETPLLSMFDKSKASKMWLRDFTTGGNCCLFTYVSCSNYRHNQGIPGWCSILSMSWNYPPPRMPVTTRTIPFLVRKSL